MTVFLSALAVLQNSLLPFFLKPFLIPYLSWIPFFYFLFYKNFFESLSLLILVSLLSSVFLPHSLTVLFFIYLSGFLIFFILKEIFLFRSISSFAAVVFFLSFYFSFLIEKGFFERGFSSLSFSGPPRPDFLTRDSLNLLLKDQLLYYFSKSFMTSLLSLPSVLIFKKISSKGALR